MRLIEIRRLAAADMAWAGPKKIAAEFVVGVFAPLALGAVSLVAGLGRDQPLNWETALGAWLLGIGVNYIPIALYAIDLLRSGRVETEGRPEIAHARRYGTQQFILLVPFLVAAIALMQESRRRQAR